MFKLLSNFLGIFIVATAFLALVRFAGPVCAVCRVSGKGAHQKTVCLALVEFTGDDLLSIYRIRPALITRNKNK